jgi:hypothetical protein
MNGNDERRDAMSLHKDDASARPYCVHCHAPLYVDSIDPRWRGYCHDCIRRLIRQRHPESA